MSVRNEGASYVGDNYINSDVTQDNGTTTQGYTISNNAIVDGANGDTLSTSQYEITMKANNAESVPNINSVNLYATDKDGKVTKVEGVERYVVENTKDSSSFYRVDENGNYTEVSAQEFDNVVINSDKSVFVQEDGITTFYGELDLDNNTYVMSADMTSSGQ